MSKDKIVFYSGITGEDGFSIPLSKADLWQALICYAEMLESDFDHLRVVAPEIRAVDLESVGDIIQAKIKHVRGIIDGFIIQASDV